MLIMEEKMRDCRIRTKRLILREIQEKDGDLIVSLRSNPDVYRFFKSPRQITLEEHLHWYHEVYRAREDLVSWICGDRAADVGIFGVRRTGKNSVEVSYLLDHAYQHKGYAREAVTAIIEWSKANWGVQSAVAEIHKENAASRRFIESLGFVESDGRGNYIRYLKKDLR